MTTIEFSLDQQAFKKAAFRKYINDLKSNQTLRRGAKRLILVVLTIFLLRLIFNTSFFQYLSLLALVLSLLLFLLIISGNYSTWKDGGRTFQRLFKDTSCLIFMYNNQKFVYGSEQVNKEYPWSIIDNVFVLSRLGMIILEDTVKDQFYLKLSNEELEELRLALKGKDILVFEI